MDDIYTEPGPYPTRWAWADEEGPMDEPLPKPDMRERDSGPGKDAVLAFVGGTTCGRVMLTFKNPDGPEAINLFISQKDARRLAAATTEVLTALSGRNN